MREKVGKWTERKKIEEKIGKPERKMKNKSDNGRIRRREREEERR